MARLVKFELLNIFKGVSFYICAICIVILSITSVGVRALADVLIYGLDIADLGKVGYSGIKFLIESPAQSDFALLIGILATISVCTGYSDKTYRNILSRGFSRYQIFFGKCISISVAAFILSAISMLIGFITGTIFWGAGGIDNSNSIFAIIVELLICVGIGIMYVAISFAFKKMGIAIVIAVMTPSLFSIGATAIDYVLEYKEIALRVTPFFLTNTLSYVAIDPNNKIVLAEGFICFAIYLVTMICVGIYAVRKDEI